MFKLAKSWHLVLKIRSTDFFDQIFLTLLFTVQE